MGLLERFGPQPGIAFVHRSRASGLRGIGPRVSAPVNYGVVHQPVAERLSDRSRAQLATAASIFPASRVPWTKRDERNYYAASVASRNRGRGPKSWEVTGAASYSPVPNAERAPSGVSGAITRVVQAITSPFTSNSSDKECTNCG